MTVPAADPGGAGVQIERRFVAEQRMSDADFERIADMDPARRAALPAATRAAFAAEVDRRRTERQTMTSIEGITIGGVPIEELDVPSPYADED